MRILWTPFHALAHLLHLNFGSSEIDHDVQGHVCGVSPPSEWRFTFTCAWCGKETYS